MTTVSADLLPQRWRTKIDIQRVQGCPVPGPCWLWTGTKNRAYGKLTDGYRTKQAHRAFYELLIGAIPDELELDHLCSNTYCCNPAHLQPVTRAVNMRRAVLRRRGWSWTDIKNDEAMRQEADDRLEAIMARPSPAGLSQNSRFRRTVHKRAKLEMKGQ